MEENDIKKLYDELAEKEQALILAAQFGKSLIDEKEELEKQIENLKREHQFQLEYYEQESFEMKRLTETMRNEYETKISHLNEDINMLNKELKQYKIENSDLLNSNKNSDNLDLIQELNEKNQNLAKQLKMAEYQLALSNEKYQKLELNYNDKNQILNEKILLLSNYQKEIQKWSNKQNELEYVLMQSCAERDKQAQIIDELTKKFIIIENEKNEFENLVYRHENDIYNLRRINKQLSLKLQNICKKNTKCLTDSMLINRQPFNLELRTTNFKFSEDDSAFDSISNLDNTSEFDDDYDIDSTYLDILKGNDLDDIENSSVEVLDRKNYFDCSQLVLSGVSWKQESGENEAKRTKQDEIS
ncbi:unnamed protein product [Brachionus calyciflorus]|uniref:Uncharacterized protein n=1 Tax=Brachionus calyciflorus TaxID=104777 RepID=A0A813T3J9_9BILA|nr:unnamed protein product [Brachionus calyciflorus]